MLVLGGTFLGYFVDQDWFLFAGFLGTMLIIFALTGFCPMSIILHSAGAGRCKC